MSSQKPFSRTVTDMGNGCAGISIPKGLRDQHDVEVGDELQVNQRDGEYVVVLD